MDAQSLRPLVEAFIWPLIFLMTCDDETLDGRTSTRQTVQIVDSLSRLDQATRLLVIQTLEDISRESSQASVRVNIAHIIELLDGPDEPDATEKRGIQ